MTFHQIVSLALGAVLIENFVLTRFLGVCPFLGVSTRMSSAWGMGAAVTFVMTLSGALTWVVNAYLLVPFGLEYMRTVAYILVIAALVQTCGMFMRKAVPPLYSALGIYLPLITTNCAVLGSALIITQNGMGFTEGVLFGLFSGAGFALALALFSSVRERIEFSDVPKSFEGFPAALAAAALISMAFMGFSGIKI